MMSFIVLLNGVDDVRGSIVERRLVRQDDVTLLVAVVTSSMV